MRTLAGKQQRLSVVSATHKRPLSISKEPTTEVIYIKDIESDTQQAV